MHYCWVCLSLSDCKGEHEKTHSHKIRVTKWNNSLDKFGGGTKIFYDLSPQSGPEEIKQDPSGRGEPI